jgi:hypothetical protein
VGAAGRLRGSARGGGGTGVRAAGLALAVDDADRELDGQSDGDRERDGDCDGQREHGESADRDDVAVRLGIGISVTVGIPEFRVCGSYRWEDQRTSGSEVEYAGDAAFDNPAAIEVGLAEVLAIREPIGICVGFSVAIGQRVSFTLTRDWESSLV